MTRSSIRMNQKSCHADSLFAFRSLGSYRKQEAILDVHQVITHKTSVRKNAHAFYRGRRITCVVSNEYLASSSITTVRRKVSARSPLSRTCANIQRPFFHCPARPHTSVAENTVTQKNWGRGRKVFYNRTAKWTEPRHRIQSRWRRMTRLL